MQNMYQAIRRDAAAIHGEPLLERKQIGRRLFGVSREMLRRINMPGTQHHSNWTGIKGLKRIELRIPRWTMAKDGDTLKIRLAGA
ncbi:hypothetical protein [Parapedobacter composti]|uniref:hypothetical protein n=1 Tax=Parapedobacter composti TaxID=623281 RepID=UPI00111435D6|nr:hypothetical protein [Parapedobacter composti]